MNVINIILALCILLISATSGETAELRSGFAKVSLECTGITRLQVDPSGQGKYSKISFIKNLYPESWEPTPSTKITVNGSRAVISPLEAREIRIISPQNGIDTPVMLEKGHALAQRFHVPEGCELLSVSAHLPTWNVNTSGVTLSLYQDDKLIASQRLTNVPDNSWQKIDPPTALSEGLYTLEISDPVGTIGWWSASKDIDPEGEALTDGLPAQGDRAIQIVCRKLLGTGSLSLDLQKNVLTIEAEYKHLNDSIYSTFPWRWRTTWTRDGYDCTPKANVLFNRFYSDNQRYMPIQQLKRRGNGGLSFDGCKWIEMDGTTSADLRVSADSLNLHWEMSPDEMSLHYDTPMERDGDMRRTKWRISIEPRDDSVPSEFPRFGCSDKSVEANLNRFWWERGFTYPSPVGASIEWAEWMALIREWFSGPQHDGQIRLLAGYPITSEGYVHTWGQTPGWPLVQNRDTRHFDTNARFILACWRHYLWTGDRSFIQSQSERLRSAMRYQLEVLHGTDGLIITPDFKTGRHEDLSDNYWDVLPFGHLDAYANAVFYASLTAMEQIDNALGEKSLVNYASLRKIAHARYDEIFWDDAKGRYIGCVDSDGVKHDYGFTFVNLEALYYGLGDKEKARHIYKWMETEPTSSGKADTYSRWIFAPRATTIHNPMWGSNPNAEKNSPQPAWWTYWWRGTLFGDQCQDGGAILYTSFYDLMDRAQYGDADNAWKRFMEILNRYRMPDRLCGGSPLYRGEKSQQEDAGSVGLDHPFPESGLVPCYFLYGIIGLSATPDGLHIKPNLPKALTYAEVRNISWQGMSLHIRVTRTTVTIDGRTRDNKPIARRFKIKPGESVIVPKN